jgi:cell division protein ZapA
MGQVSVPVNGRAFTITCDDGQEVRTRRLAQYVDAKVGQFAASVGQVGDAKLLLLTALLIADELADANEALEQERARLSSDQLADGTDEMSKPAEAIAARLAAS